jgi:hypothetical protein
METFPKNGFQRLKKPLLEYVLWDLCGGRLTDDYFWERHNLALALCKSGTRLDGHSAGDPTRTLMEHAVKPQQLYATAFLKDKGIPVPEKLEYDILSGQWTPNFKFVDLINNIGSLLFSIHLLPSIESFLQRSQMHIPWKGTWVYAFEHVPQRIVNVSLEKELADAAGAGFCNVVVSLVYRGADAQGSRYSEFDSPKTPIYQAHEGACATAIAFLYEQGASSCDSPQAWAQRQKEKEERRKAEQRRAEEMAREQREKERNAEKERQRQRKERKRRAEEK